MSADWSPYALVAASSPDGSLDGTSWVIWKSNISEEKNENIPGTDIISELGHNWFRLWFVNLAIKTSWVKFDLPII